MQFIYIYIRMFNKRFFFLTGTRPATASKPKNLATCNRPKTPASRPWTWRAVTRTPRRTARRSASSTWPAPRDSCRSVTICPRRRHSRPQSPSCSSSWPPNRPHRNRLTTRGSNGRHDAPFPDHLCAPVLSNRTRSPEQTVQKIFHHNVFLLLPV